VLATTKNPEHLAQEASFFIFATASLGLIIIALSLFRYFVTRVGKAVFSFDEFWARSYVWQSLSFVSCQLLLTRFPCLRHYSLATKIEMEFASSYVLVQEKEEKVAFDIEKLNSSKKTKSVARKQNIKKSDSLEGKKRSTRKSKFSFGPKKSKKSGNENKLSSFSGSSNESENDLDDTEVLATSDALSGKQIRSVRKATTNVLAINLGSLSDVADAVATGDPTFCNRCGACLNSLSKLKERSQVQDFTESNRNNSRQIQGSVDSVNNNNQSSIELEGNFIWKCEFCDERNYVLLEEDEIPKKNVIDYLLEPPADTKDADDSIVVFCIDISGSMCCTTEVHGGLKFKTNQKNEELFKELNSEGIDQWLPNQNRDVSYVSRLQCVQGAIDLHLEQLRAQHPKRKVAIVTFNNEVTIYESTGTSHTIAGDKLNDSEYLINIANNLKIDLKTPIEKNKKDLSDLIFLLEEKGETALGPALLVSIGLAGMQRGSNVILCTDGAANVGVGTLEDLTTQDKLDAAQVFYQNAAFQAKQRGVTVSIISMKGTNVAMELLAQVALQTNGFNDIVDPTNLTQNFNFILQNPIVATNVRVKMFLHRALKFRHQENVKDSTCTREIGNASKETTITFEYKVKSPKEVTKLTDRNALPFQVQVHFTRLDGAKCVRVISAEKKITQDRSVAEENVNVAVVGIHAHQNAAKLAALGNYTKAQSKYSYGKVCIKKRCQ